MNQIKALFGGIDLGRHAANRKDGDARDSSINIKNILWGLLAVVVVAATIFLGIRLWPASSSNQHKAQSDTMQSKLDEKRLIEAYNKGEYKAVIPDLQKLVESQEGNLEARDMLATSYLLTGDNKRALEEFEAILKLKPNDVEMLYKIGVLLQHTGRTNEAITYLNRATKAAPDVALFHSELARANTKAKYYADAIEEWKAVLNLLPPGDKARANVLAELADVYIAQNDLIQARGIIATGLALDPENEALKSIEAKIGGQIQGASQPGS